MKLPFDRRRIGFLFALFLGGFVLGFIIRNVIPVAIVNGEKISRAQFVGELIRLSGPTAMNGLVTKKLVFQEASKKNITVSDSDVKKKLGEIEKELKGRGFVLEDLYVEQNMSADEFIAELRFQMTVDSLFKKGIKVEDKDIENYFKDTNIVKGKDAIFESQLIAIRKNIYNQKLEKKYNEWLVKTGDNAKIQYLIGN